MVSSSAIYAIDLYCQNLEGVLGLKTYHHVQAWFENSILVLDPFGILGMMTDNIYSTCQCNKRIPPQKKGLESVKYYYW